MLRHGDIAVFSVPVVLRGHGAPQERLKGWSVSAHGHTLQLNMAICCEARLAMNADRPTEYDNITMTEH